MKPTPTPPVALPQPHVIDPNGVYFADQARALLRLRADTIKREIRLGRLRVSKRSKRYYFLGKWLLAWIEAGEVKRKNSAAARQPSISENGHVTGH